MQLQLPSNFLHKPSLSSRPVVNMWRLRVKSTTLPPNNMEPEGNGPFKRTCVFQKSPNVRFHVLLGRLVASKCAKTGPRPARLDGSGQPGPPHHTHQTPQPLSHECFNYARAPCFIQQKKHEATQSDSFQRQKSRARQRVEVRGENTE